MAPRSQEVTPAGFWSLNADMLALVETFVEPQALWALARADQRCRDAARQACRGRLAMRPRARRVARRAGGEEVGHARGAVRSGLQRTESGPQRPLVRKPTARAHSLLQARPRDIAHGPQGPCGYLPESGEQSNWRCVVTR